MKLLRNVLAHFIVAFGAMAIALLSFHARAQDSETLSFNVGGSNGACGEWMPDAGARYDRDSDTTPVRLDVSLSPNGGCTGQAVSVEAEVSQHVDLSDLFYVDLTAAYQLQTIPFEYLLPAVANDPAKHFFAYDVTTTQASAGLGVDLGNWRFSAGYNAAEILDASGDPLDPWRVELSGSFGPVEVDFSAIQLVQWLSVAWSGSGNTVFSLDAVRGAGRLLLPPKFRGEENEYKLAGGPNVVYRASVGWEF